MTTKVEPKLAPAFRELLPIKTTAVTLDANANHRTRSFVVDMDDALTPQDLNDNPSLWRNVQKSRDKALNALDSVMLVWHDRVAFAVVDYADTDEVQFLKMDIKTRRERDREPWQNATYAVRAINSQWSYYRKAGNIRMTSASWPTWEAARDACTREQAPARV
jgi:hypothetical protein